MLHAHSLDHSISASVTHKGHNSNSQRAYLWPQADVTNPGSERCLRLLKQVPDLTAGLGAAASAEVDDELLGDFQTLGFLAHLFVDVLLALVVAVLAARLEVQLVDAPVGEIVTEGHHAHLVDEVQLARPVEAEH